MAGSLPTRSTKDIGMSAATMAGQTMLVIFQGSRVIGEASESDAWLAGGASRVARDLHWGGKRRRGGGDSVEDEAQEYLSV